MAKKKSVKSDESPGFEASLAELEKIVHELEEGQIGLEESLARYEQGVKLLRRCHGLLSKAERRIELLSGVDADGNPVTQPMDDESGTLEEKAASRSRRRTATSTKKTKTDRLGEEPNSLDDGDDVDEPGTLF
jgi:exodeoxyribonuclease VII small subunit